MTTDKTLKVLVVDDDKTVREFLIRFLKLQHIDSQPAEDGLAAIELAKKEKFDLVFMDIRMPKMNGLQAYVELKKYNPDLVCIFMTGYATEAGLLDSMTSSPVTVCLRKPFENISFIKDVVNKVIEGIEMPSTGDGKIKDRRAFVRLDIVLEIEYKLKQSPGPFIHILSKDIAPGGIRLLLHEYLPVGSLLDVVIRIPESSVICKATGEIVWISDVQNSTGCFDSGIKITEIDFAEFARLLTETGRI